MADDTNETYCHLLELPRELRDYIWEEAIVHKAVLEISSRGDPVDSMDEWRLTDRSWARFRPSEPALTKVCRQIRDEALPLFYGMNQFRDSEYDPRCIKFIKWLTSPKRAMLGMLQIGAYGYECFDGNLGPEPRTVCVCSTRAKADLERLKTWLQKKDLLVPASALYVPVRSAKDTTHSWTNQPDSECKEPDCCGNEKAPAKLMGPDSAET